MTILALLREQLRRLKLAALGCCYSTHPLPTTAHWPDGFAPTRNAFLHLNKPLGFTCLLHFLGQHKPRCFFHRQWTSGKTWPLGTALLNLGQPTGHFVKRSVPVTGRGERMLPDRRGKRSFCWAWESGQGMPCGLEHCRRPCQECTLFSKQHRRGASRRCYSR